FSALANYVLEKNGVVVGCEYDEKFNPIHVIINNKEDMLPIRGSKYVQSDTLDTYTRVKEFLTSGTYVLYTGTPCQIAGLKCFLKNEYETLITVDLVCHGVPSNKIFHEYLSFLEKKHRGKVIDYKFRDKQKHGWASAGSYIINKKEKNIIKSTFPTNDYYYYYYLKGDIYRESCYKCKYACSTREGDFTIADFWNVQKYHPEIYNKNGVSLVFLNNEKSKNIFNDLKFNLVYFESKLEYAVNENGNLKVPSQRPKERDDVYQRIEKDGFKKTAQKDCKLTYIIPTIKRAIPASFKRKLLTLIKRNETKK
ncbi:MAG: Coenzyme F420 hydrogenase/dehydrogenase, beta subunit C-terminal domain, partial [Oscillospiraceae bacterium]